MESQQTFKLEPISEEEELAHHEKEFAIISRKFSMTRRSKQAPAGVEDFDEKARKFNSSRQIHEVIVDQSKANFSLNDYQRHQRNAKEL